jgi:hypothetical protein
VVGGGGGGVRCFFDHCVDLKAGRGGSWYLDGSFSYGRSRGIDLELAFVALTVLSRRG